MRLTLGVCGGKNIFNNYVHTTHFVYTSNLFLSLLLNTVKPNVHPDHREF